MCLYFEQKVVKLILMWRLRFRQMASLILFGFGELNWASARTRMRIKTLLCLLFCFSGIVHGQNQQHIPCTENGLNCYVGIERCHKSQLCILETWIGFLIAFLTTLALAMIMFFIYYILKDQRIFNLCLAIAFSMTALGFLIATTCYAVIKDNSPPITSGEAGIMVTDLMELAENEVGSNWVSTGTTDLSFSKAFAITTLSVYIFCAVLVFLYYSFYFYRRNFSEPPDLHNKVKHFAW